MATKQSQKQQFWIMKSEPEEFSIDDLRRKKRVRWDGIRNYQVRNMLRDKMNIGDTALFYHSSTQQIGVVGEMVIISNAYTDPSQFDRRSKYFDKKSIPGKPRWLAVDVRFLKKYPRVVTLSELRGRNELANLPLLKKGNRLSVMSITENEYKHVVALVTR